MGLIAAWLGWAFDGLDGYLYVLVAGPFVKQLLGDAPREEVQLKASIIQAVFLVGWAVGGAVFGRLGDRLGRSRTLTLTILTYALFTGLGFFATRWWHLLIFRFVAALGIGGEWAAGSALVCETMPVRHRAWVSATLQSGYMVGCIAATLTQQGLAHLGRHVEFPGGQYRYVFLVGIVPALLTLWIRRAVPEPPEWREKVRTQAVPRVSALFGPGLAWRTTTVLILASIALTTVWAFLYFIQQIIRSLNDVKGWDEARVSDLVARVTISFLLVNIGANFFATYLAKRVGHRAAFFVMMAGALAVSLIGYRRPPTLDNIVLLASATAFFNLGLFGLFPMYIPPLYPTLLRTLGAGFCYNTGRLVSAAGTFFLGTIAHGPLGPTGAMWWIGLLFIPGMVVALLVPELPREERAGTAD
jgi:predicted MFS family arabinose efflux permease